MAYGKGRDRHAPSAASSPCATPAPQMPGGATPPMTISHVRCCNVRPLASFDLDRHGVDRFAYLLHPLHECRLELERRAPLGGAPASLSTQCAPNSSFWSPTAWAREIRPTCSFKLDIPPTKPAVSSCTSLRCWLILSGTARSAEPAFLTCRNAEASALLERTRPLELDALCLQTSNYFSVCRGDTSWLYVQILVSEPSLRNLSALSAANSSSNAF